MQLARVKRMFAFAVLMQCGSTAAVFAAEPTHTQISEKLKSGAHWEGIWLGHVRTKLTLVDPLARTADRFFELQRYSMLALGHNPDQGVITRFELVASKRKDQGSNDYPPVSTFVRPNHLLQFPEYDSNVTQVAHVPESATLRAELAGDQARALAYADVKRFAAPNVKPENVAAWGRDLYWFDAQSAQMRTKSARGIQIALSEQQLDQLTLITTGMVQGMSGRALPVAVTRHVFEELERRERKTLAVAREYGTFELLRDY